MSAPSPLKSPQWFKGPAERAGSEGPASVLLKWAIGLLAGLIFYSFGLSIMAYVVWGLASAIGIASLASKSLRQGIEGAFVRFGAHLGRFISVLTLTPVFYVGFTIVRLYDRMAGRDPLALKLDDSPSYWVACDSDTRKRSVIKGSFSAEVLTGRSSIMTVILGLLALLVIGEGLLRTQGFGDPVLYVDDVHMGYAPAPGQKVSRQGNRIEINSLGMRAPERNAIKATGTFRILLLGDSTVYGGSYIDQPELYARRLEGQLDSAIEGKTVEVFNMGVNGWGPFHELGYVTRHGIHGADLVVVALPFGDVWRPLSRLAAQPYLPVHSPPALAYEELVYHLTWRWRSGRINQRNAKEREARIVNGLKAYTELAQRVQRLGAEVVFEVLPSQLAGTGDTVPEREANVVARLRKALSKTPVGFPAGLFAKAQSDDALFHDGVHLGAGGHAVYAEYLKGRLFKVSDRLKAFAGRSAP